MNAWLSQNFKLATALMLSTVVLSCSNPSPKMTTRPPNEQKKASDSTNVVDSAAVQVDILLVMANDTSMADHDSNLATNISLFTSQIFQNKLVDYHIGVITAMSTDQHQGAWGGRLSGTPKFVDPTTPNPVTTLQANMNLGHDADDPVALFTVTEMALTPPISTNENLGFLRPNADLVVMYISDTDPEDSGPSADDFYKFLVGLKGGDTSRISVYAAYVPDQSVCSGEGNPTQLNQLLKLAQPNSFGFGLCDPNFGSQLAKISNRIANGIRKIFDLSRLPVVDSIEVTYGGQNIPNDPDTGWTYDPARNRVALGPHLVLPPAPQGSKIEISYSVAGE